MNEGTRRSASRARVFLSYAREDQAQAAHLAELFSESGAARVFLDQDQISWGENWRNRLREKMQRSDLFVVLVSPRLTSSARALQEIGAIWALRKPALMVLTGEDEAIRLPVELDEIGRVSLEELERPATVRSLLERVTRH
jgi:hypothetical protein